MLGGVQCVCECGVGYTFVTQTWWKQAFCPQLPLPCLPGLRVGCRGASALEQEGLDWILPALMCMTSHVIHLPGLRLLFVNGE